MSVTWFGQSPNTGGRNWSLNFATVVKAICTLSGNVTDGRIFIQNANDGAKFKLGLYTVVSGSPSVLLGVSNEITLSGTGWHQISYPTPIAVTNTVEYGLAFNCNSNTFVGQCATSGITYYQSSAYPAFPSSLSPSTLTQSLFTIEAGVAAAAAAFVPLVTVIN